MWEKNSVPRIVVVVVAFLGFGFCAAWAAGENEPDSLVHHPWEKLCLNSVNGAPTCFTGSDVRTVCTPIVANAATIISTKGTVEILRLTIPQNGGTPRGVGFAVDGGEMMIARNSVKCSLAGCTADYPVDAALIAKLRQGETLLLTEADTPDRIMARLPLAGFAAAYDGPPHEPKVFEETNAMLQQELERRTTVCAAK